MMVNHVVSNIKLIVIHATYLIEVAWITTY